MDSNKNEKCRYNTNINGGRLGAGRTGIIETNGIAKADTAAKYQNQFNNNNLIEQKNLMPSAKDDEPPVVMVGQNGAGAGVPHESHAKEKILAVNGSSRTVNTLFPSSVSSTSSSVAVARNVSEDRVPSGQQNVECLTSNPTASFIPAINGTSSGYSRQTISCIPEALPRSNNADHPLETSATGGGVVCDRRDELTLEAAGKVKAEDGPGAGAPDDADFSDNNSVGNLSYISENGLIEEIILLPNNAYSDDDNASTSDDCIYAYRGGEPGGAAGLLLELRGDQPPDDETDFLEMDFDPEPSSEMENFDSSQREQVLSDDAIAGASSSTVRANETQLLHEASTSNSPRPPHVPPLSPKQKGEEELGPTQLMVEKVSSAQTPSLEDHASILKPLARPLPLPGASTAGPLEKNIGGHVTKEIHDTGGNAGLVESNHRSNEPMNRSPAHKTGAIPKAVPLRYANIPSENDRTPAGRCSSNAKNLKLDLNLCLDDIDGDAGAKRRYLERLLYIDGVWTDELVADNENSVRNDDFELYCSECGKLEFTGKPWVNREADARWMCKNCAFMHDDKVFRRRTGSFRCRADELDHRRMDQSAAGCRSEAEALDIRAEQIALEALSKINTLKETPPSSGVSRRDELPFSRNRLTTAAKVVTKEQSLRVLQDQEVPTPDYYQHAVGNCSENTVTIYTINCGELTIIEALTRIGIAPNLDVLRQYFNEQYEVDTSKMNIPQYLLHMSKRDCNYKKLIEAIKSCCDGETLDVQYYPLDPFSDTPEIVQISSCEIAKRWNANTNLRQIIHFKHKHFHTLNVLGKIVNIIRQPSRGRHTTHTIGIPQYYKSGSVTITRAAGASS